MRDLSIASIRLSQANGFVLLKDADLLSWEQPSFTTMTRGGREALIVGSLWPDSPAKLVLKVGIFGSSESDLREKLGKLHRALYSSYVLVTDNTLNRTLVTVLGSSVKLETFPASNYAEAGFTLVSKQHGWRESSYTEVESSNSSFQIEVGDVPIQDMIVLMGVASNGKARIRINNPASELSLDLTNAPEIPGGALYWYKVDTTSWQAGKVDLDEFWYDWDDDDDVSQYLSMSHPGFTLTPNNLNKCTILATGTQAVKLQYRKVWVG